MKTNDIIFISYDEENAEENWLSLSKSFPHAKRVQNVKGIHEAHRKAKEISETKFFYTVDGDNQIINNPFKTFPGDLNANAVYVWRAINSVNGLVYGYGGIKLWSKSLFEKRDPLNNFIDHATEITPDYRVVPTIGSKTLFNTSPYSSWKSGFREAYKLTKNFIDNNDKRALDWLMNWLSVGLHAKDGLWCILGAHEGALIALSGDSISINRFEDLRAIFEAKNHSTVKEDLLKISQKKEFQEISKLINVLSPSESFKKASQLTQTYRFNQGQSQAANSSL